MSNTVYIETSVISYLTARPSRDLVTAAYQQITRDWWNTELPKYHCFISDFVVDEISRGDSEAASARLKVIEHFQKIAVNTTVSDLVEEYKRTLNIPEKAYLDLYHLAVAVGNGMDYIISWNFKHIANAFVRDRISTVNNSLGLRTPTICTPEELIGGDNE